MKVFVALLALVATASSFSPMVRPRWAIHVGPHLTESETTPAAKPEAVTGYEESAPSGFNKQNGDYQFDGDVEKGAKQTSGDLTPDP